MNGVETLTDLVRRRLLELGDEGQPLPASRAAAKARGKVSAELIRVIVRGEHKGGLRDDTAEGLAMALDVPVQEVYDAAGALRPGTPWQWPSRFDRLGPRQRTLVQNLAAALLDAYDQGRADEAKKYGA